MTCSGTECCSSPTSEELKEVTKELKRQSHKMDFAEDGMNGFCPCSEDSKGLKCFKSSKSFAI
jgi:hypothetical protein